LNLRNQLGLLGTIDSATILPATVTHAPCPQPEKS